MEDRTTIESPTQPVLVAGGYEGFVRHEFEDRSQFFTGRIPDSLCLSEAGFKRVWDSHPAEFHVVNIGGPKKTPRFQQAQGVDYYYSGHVNRAIPITSDLEPFLEWAKRTIHPRLSGLLLNWYDGPDHYIGGHNDSTINMYEGDPIVTISFGEDRVFSLTHPELKVTHKFRAPHGTVFILPYDTNLKWKHAVLKSKRYSGRRISITIRGLFPLD